MDGYRIASNPDLTVGPDKKQRWNRPAHRRAGFHNAHLMYRYGITLRAPLVLQLRDAPEPGIADLPEVAALTEHPAFSGMIVARGDAVLFERCAADFAPDRPHSIQSITKLHVNLIAGELIAAGLLDPARTVAEYLPWIGSGYAGATLQAVLDMDVQNRFSEDYADPDADVYAYEIAMGWRLPEPGAAAPGIADVLAGIVGDDLVNRAGHALYKSSNTDLLAFIAAAVSGVSLQYTVRRIAEAAGYEGVLHLSTDATGFPALSGGACLSLRDLARFGLLLARRGAGADGSQVGSAAFIEASRSRPAPPMPAPRDWIRYSNQMFTNGRWIGHAGYGGQFLMVDMETGTVGAFFSVLENEAGFDAGYMSDVIRMLERAIGAR